MLEFFGENCVLSFGFSSGAESFNLEIPGKTIPWKTSICLTIWEEADCLQFVQRFGKRSVVFHYRQRNVKMYIFSDETCFANGVSTSSLFNFNLSTLSLLINFIITFHAYFPFLQSLNPLTASICFYVSMLWLLVTIYKTKLILWKTLIMVITYDTSTNRTFKMRKTGIF